MLQNHSSDMFEMIGDFLEDQLERQNLLTDGAQAALCDFALRLSQNDEARQMNPAWMLLASRDATSLASTLAACPQNFMGWSLATVERTNDFLQQETQRLMSGWKPA